MTTQAISQNVRMGVLLIILAALLIATQDATFKSFTTDMTLWQIFVMRGVVAMPMLLLMGGVRGKAVSLMKEACSSGPLARSLCLTLAFVVFYAVLPFLNLSTAGAALYMAPIFVALLSAFLIGEPVRRLAWMGVFLGFAGVLVLLRPASDAFSWLGLVPLMSAVAYSLGHIITRTRCQNVSVEALSFSLNMTLFIAGILISVGLLIWPQEIEPNSRLAYVFGQWGALDQSSWILLFVLAAFAVLIGMTLAGAYQKGPPATIATFEYSYLVFVAAWDVFLFGTELNAGSLAGMIMIAGAGVLVLKAGRT